MAHHNASSNALQPIHRYEISYTSRVMPTKLHQPQTALAPAPSHPLLLSPIVPFQFRLPASPRPAHVYRSFCGCPCMMCYKRSKEIIEPFQENFFQSAMNFITSSMDSALRAFGLADRFF